MGTRYVLVEVQGDDAEAAVTEAVQIVKGWNVHPDLTWRARDVTSFMGDYEHETDGALSQPN